MRWSENVLWQFFSGLDYYEHRLPCDATQIGRFRRDLGEDGMELLLKATIDTAVAIKAVKPKDLERVIVDTTVQKAIAHPVDSRLLEIARHKVVSAAERAGIQLKQTFAKEGTELRRRAGGYAHAKQFRRLKKVVKRQRTILGIVMREVQRKSEGPDFAPDHPKAASDLMMWLERAERIRTQQRNDKNKLYALHAPEVECLAKGKARKPFEFGVKSAVVVSHKHGLMLGARTFPGNPYDGHILNAALEQATNLMQDHAVKLKQIVVDLGFRGVDADNLDVQIIHRGKFKSLTSQQKRWLRRRQAVEPAIGHLKSDNRMDRCWLQGALGDALHAVSCAAGYNLRWLVDTSRSPSSLRSWSHSRNEVMGRGPPFFDLREQSPKLESGWVKVKRSTRLSLTPCAQLALRETGHHAHRPGGPSRSDERTSTPADTPFQSGPVVRPENRRWLLWVGNATSIRRRADFRSALDTDGVAGR